MITVHSYCSYKNSPSGFVYGSFKIDEPADNDSYLLSDKYNRPFVRSAFECGIIRRVSGKIPNSSKYIFLVRKLKYDYGNDHDDVGREVQMNFAFEFDTFDEFSSFVSGYSNAESQNASALYKHLADCIIPDTGIETYKYRISKGEFESWIELISQGSSQKQDKFRDRICITTSSKSTDYTENISKIFNFPYAVNGEPVEWCRNEATGDYVYPCKKKPLDRWKSKLRPILLVTVLVLFVLVLILLSLFGIHTKDADKKSVKAKNTGDIICEQNIDLTQCSDIAYYCDNIENPYHC